MNKNDNKLINYMFEKDELQRFEVFTKILSENY